MSVDNNIEISQNSRGAFNDRLSINLWLLITSPTNKTVPTRFPIRNYIIGQD
ncbi:hypothetical protein LV92_01525 [Arenibacter echinorum]|uniref:Uncharacterized protein n=1 Tax=Arenibacter echinorum TaxID=440515 RepID=A0A327R8J7_9FLAO|nr:hypothetical protein LV92_01525 [Arenibacter echinorum]